MSNKKCEFFDVWPEKYNERFECDIPINDVMDWIKNRFEPSDKVTEHTSYTYKNIMEKDLMGYISNYAFKMCMLKAGFEVDNYFDINWRFYARYVESNC